MALPSSQKTPSSFSKLQNQPTKPVSLPVVFEEVFQRGREDLNLMKKSGLLAASFLAASATAVGATATATSSSTFTVTIKPPHQEVGSSQETGASTKEKFAPRFDGMKFIETLVTAHR